ncbi:MAG: hypothetical protein FP811_00700 [Desulfobacteraceae bacterium]|nr:hypothetical protein [Desulfobacteraceae bacterium]
MMAKCKPRGKGIKAFHRLKTMSKEVGDINNCLKAASKNLIEIIGNKNIDEKFMAESKLLPESKPPAESNPLTGSETATVFKRRSRIEQAPTRIEFKFYHFRFYIDFTMVAAEADGMINIEGNIIYGTNRPLCFADCINPEEECNCQRTVRCDNLEDKPLIQFSVNRHGMIQSSGKLEGELWTTNEEDLLDLHYRALDLIWKEALDWANKIILP